MLTASSRSWPTRSATASACSSSRAAATTRLRSSEKRARKLGRRDFPAATRVLPGPERRKIALALAFRLCAQRRDGAGGKRVSRRKIAHITKVLHEAVDDAARRTAGEEVGERGMTHALALQCRAMHRARGRFRA